jgi:hypothetical protein
VGSSDPLLLRCGGDEVQKVASQLSESYVLPEYIKNIRYEIHRVHVWGDLSQGELRL